MEQTNLTKEQRSYRKYRELVRKENKKPGINIQPFTPDEYLSQKEGYQAWLEEKGYEREKNINRYLVNKQKYPEMSPRAGKAMEKAMKIEAEKRHNTAFEKAAIEAESLGLDKDAKERYIKRRGNKLYKESIEIYTEDGEIINLAKTPAYKLRQMGKAASEAWSSEMNFNSLYHQLKEKYKEEGMSNSEAVKAAKRYISVTFYGSPE